jgi:hypothetical protein
MSSAFRDAHQHFLIFVFVFFVSLNIYATAWSIVLLLSFVVVVFVVVTGMMYQFVGDFFFNTYLFVFYNLLRLKSIFATVSK